MSGGEADRTAEHAPRTPNSVLRDIRESERHESRAEFAEAMARTAWEMGLEVYPDGQYVQRLESGHIKWPHRTHRNILEKLCGRPAHELGFAPSRHSVRDSAAISSRVNVTLREAVWESGIELTEFARKIEVHPKTLERWITRGVIPQPVRRWQVSLLLGIDESEIWPEAVLGQESPQDVPSAPVVSATVIEDAEDVTDVLKRVQKLHGSTVHPDIIYQLQANIRQTITQYESLQHSVIVPALRKQRALIESLLDECGHPAQRKQLFEVAGATSGVLGYVSVGSSDFALARAYCLEAFQLGDFAGDANLQAWARGLQSFCEYYAGRYDEALNFANNGLNYAQSGPQSVRLTINGKARAMGRLGDVRGVDRAVGEAYELMSFNDVPSGVPSSIAFECYSEAQTASNAATAYVSLAMPEKVQHYASLALPEISKSDSPWSRSLVMIDLAVSQVRAANADLDHASTLVNDALAISAGRPVSSVQQRTSEFVRDIINRWGNVPQARMIRDAASAAIERGK